MGRNQVLALLGVVSLLVLSGVLIWWRAPEWSLVWDAFELVSWQWIAAAIGLNLLSVAVRVLAWRTVVEQAVKPSFPLTRLFSAN